MYFIDTDGKTVLRARIHSSGIILENGTVVPEAKVGPRLFAVHPDENSLCRREEDGTISYESSLGRIFYGPTLD
jgi:hypothetical protein